MSSVTEIEGTNGIGLVLERNRTDENWDACKKDIDRRLKEANDRGGALYGEPLLDQAIFNDFASKYTRFYAKLLLESDANIHDSVFMVNAMAAMASVLGCSIMAFSQAFSKDGQMANAMEAMQRHMHEIIDHAVDKEKGNYERFVQETGFTHEKGIRKH